MTKTRMIDFSKPDWKSAESPNFLPILDNKYKSDGKDDVVVIDSGSWQYRAGYASKDMPALVFDPLVHKCQAKTGEAPSYYVGRTIPMGLTRTSSRTPYEEGNVMLHSASLEQILDDVFSKLNVSADKESMLNPVFMTEIVANPPYCRREVSELLFEAYQVPKVAYGIDSQLSWYYNKKDKPSTKTGLIINIGNCTTTINLIIDNKLTMTKRINFGGKMASEQMLQLMQCKYPSFPIKMTFPQAEHVVQHCSQVALDYDQTLREIAIDPAQVNVTVQYAYSSETIAEKQEKEAQREALAGKRREQAQRLRDRAEKQRAERLEAKRQQVESMKKLLRQVKDAINTEDEEAEENAINQLELFGYEGVEDLQNALVNEERQLNRLLGIEEPKEAPDYSLVEIPDVDLTPEQIKEKRKQRLLKNAADAREKIKKEKEAAEQRAQEHREAQEQRRIEDFDEWRADLYKERQVISEQLGAKQRKKEALADRKSQAASKRLKSVVSLVQQNSDEEEEANNAGKSATTKKRKTASNKSKSKQTQQQQQSKGEEGFGDDDADWLIYRQLSKEDDDEAAEEEEATQKRLTEIEELLEKHDADNFFDLLKDEAKQSTTLFDKLRRPVQDVDGKDADPNAIANQLNINVERFRVYEALFQPSSLLGCDQAGLLEAIEEMIRVLSIEVRRQIAENIFVTGGASQVAGLGERLEYELTMIFPTNSKISINFAKDAHLDTWKGAARLVKNDYDSIPWITKKWYEENGGERLPPSMTSNNDTAAGTTWFTNQF